MPTKEVQKRQRAIITAQGALDNAPSSNKAKYLNTKLANIKLFIPEAGKTYRFIFLPWKAGKGNSTGRPGMWVVNRYITVHKNIGPNGEDHLCGASMGHGCAVCSLFQQLRAKGTRGDKKYWDEVLAPLKSKFRELMLVHDTTDSDPTSVMLWDESTALFGDAFRSMYRKRPVWMAFADFDTGCIVEFEATKKAIGSNSCVECVKGIVIEQRTEPLHDKLIEAAETLCPDNWVVETPGDVLHKIVHNTGGAEDEVEGDAAYGAGNGEAVVNDPGDGVEEEVMDEVVEDQPTEVSEDEPTDPVEESTEEPEVEEEAAEEEAPEEEVEEEVVEEVAPPPRPAPRPAAKPAQAPARAPAKPATAPATTAAKPAPAKPAAKPTQAAPKKK